MVERPEDATFEENVAYTSDTPFLTGTPIGAVTWTVGGEDASQFTIDPADGVVSLSCATMKARPTWVPTTPISSPSPPRMPTTTRHQ